MSWDGLAGDDDLLDCEEENEMVVNLEEVGSNVI